MFGPILDWELTVLAAEKRYFFIRMMYVSMLLVSRSSFMLVRLKEATNGRARSNRQRGSPVVFATGS